MLYYVGFCTLFVELEKYINIRGNRNLWGSTCFNLFPDLSDSSDQSKSASTKLPWGCKGNSDSSTWVIITCIEPESITPGISHQPGFWYSNDLKCYDVAHVDMWYLCGTPHVNIPVFWPIAVLLVSIEELMSGSFSDVCSRYFLLL